MSLQKSRTLFIQRSASIDHFNPYAHGGSDQDLDNLVTACWPCNARKGDLPANLVEFVRHEPHDYSWDGLTSLYPSLWSAIRDRVPEGERRVRLAWLRLLGDR